MDTDDVEMLTVNADGGADAVTDRRPGRDGRRLRSDVGLGVSGAGDAAADVVTVNGTAAADVVQAIAVAADRAGHRPRGDRERHAARGGERPPDGRRPGRQRHALGRGPGGADAADASTAATATTRSTAATAPTRCSAGRATTPWTATRATTPRSWARATTRSSGTRATAATSSRARTAPTRCCSTAPRARRSSPRRRTAALVRAGGRRLGAAGRARIFPWIGHLAPFVLRAPDQFLSPPPPRLTSRRRARDVSEVKAPGASSRIEPRSRPTWRCSSPTTPRSSGTASHGSSPTSRTSARECARCSTPRSRPPAPTP